MKSSSQLISTPLLVAEVHITEEARIEAEEGERALLMAEEETRIAEETRLKPVADAQARLKAEKESFSSSR